MSYRVLYCITLSECFWFKTGFYCVNSSPAQLVLSGSSYSVRCTCQGVQTLLYAALTIIILSYNWIMTITFGFWFKLGIFQAIDFSSRYSENASLNAMILQIRDHPKMMLALKKGGDQRNTNISSRITNKWMRLGVPWNSRSNSQGDSRVR